jgi:hypothetical protein
MSRWAALAEPTVTKIIVTPIETALDDAKVRIVGVVSYTRYDGARRYIVSCSVEWGGYRSGTFTLDVADGAELERKLKVEVARMKLAILSGQEHLFAKVG